MNVYLDASTTVTRENAAGASTVKTRSEESYECTSAQSTRRGPSMVV
jgi:hypothetical protein